MNEKETMLTTAKRLDAVQAPILKTELMKLLDEGHDNLVIDMKNTTYVSSVGLRAFLAAQKRINEKKGSMVLKNVSQQVMEVFDITGFSGLLTFEEL
ncbi:MAG: STAS domain-containing protein [bacterium]|nr:STAS domain-containing protein [bacterium]